MPTFLITDKASGKKYKVTGATKEGALEALKHLQDHLDVNTTAKTDRLPMSTMARVKDAGASLATGVREGAESFAGTGGDVRELAKRGSDYLFGNDFTKSAGKFITENVPGGAMLGAAPTSADIHQAVEPAVQAAGVGNVLSHQPQTTAGEYLHTVGQFAPAAAAGPGGFVRKTAMAVIPAVASETAGQLTKGTGAEPYARMAGALVGGVATAGRNPSAVREAAEVAPTRAQLKEQTDELYSTLREAGIKYDADSYGTTIRDAAAELKDLGLTKSVAETAHKIMNELVDTIGTSPDFNEINGRVSALGEKARDLRRAGQNQEAKAVDIVRDHLMNFEAKAPMVSRVPLPRAEFDTLRKTARDTARRNIQARTLDEVAKDADTYASGQEAGLRNGIRNLVRSKRGKQMFNEPERSALLNVANGRKPLQTLSRFGFDLTKWNGSATFVPTMGATAVGGAFGLPAAGTLAAAGTAAKILSPRLTSKAFERASAAIRSGAMRDGTVMPAVKAKWMQKVIRSFLATDAGIHSALGNSDSAGVKREPLRLTVHPPVDQVQ